MPSFLLRIRKDKIGEKNEKLKKSVLPDFISFITLHIDQFFPERKKSGL